MKWITTFVLAFFILLVVVLGLESQRMKEQKANQDEVRQAMQALDRRLQQVEGLRPDLGDFMRDLQLEMAKLWYAEKSQNKELALFEIQEMKETIVEVGILKPKMYGVDNAGVLDALKNSQVADMKKALSTGNHKKFLEQYGQALSTCNQCHQAAGLRFIQIIVPTSPPVTNQIWKP